MSAKVTIYDDSVASFDFCVFFVVVVAIEGSNAATVVLTSTRQRHVYGFRIYYLYEFVAHLVCLVVVFAGGCLFFSSHARRCSFLSLVRGAVLPEVESIRRI